MGGVGPAAGLREGALSLPTCEIEDPPEDFASRPDDRGKPQESGASRAEFKESSS
jgi:hypothetical protein